MNSYRKDQSGAVLIVALLLLLVLTILGVVMMQTTRMQERMAGNTRDLSVALQLSESGLRVAEGTIAAAASQPATTASLGCTTATSVCAQASLPVAIGERGQFDWAGDGLGASVAGLPTGQPQPRYTVEEAGFLADSLDQGQGPQTGRQFYKLSSHSSGPSTQANTVVQSTFARRF